MPTKLPKSLVKLPEKHKQKAIELCEEFRVSVFKSGKKCRECGGKGYTKITDENFVKPCVCCVSTLPMYKAWLFYLEDYPEIRAMYLDVY